MRTNIVLDDDLVREAMKLTGLETKRAVVEEALRTLIRVKSRTRLFDYAGRVKLAPGYDHKKVREGA